MSTFPIALADGSGRPVNVDFTFAGEIRAKVWGVADIDADVYRTRAGWVWSAQVAVAKWIPLPEWQIVEDHTHELVKGRPRKKQGVAASEGEAKEAAGEWIRSKLPAPKAAA